MNRTILTIRRDTTEGTVDGLIGFVPAPETSVEMCQQALRRLSETFRELGFDVDPALQPDPEREG